MYLALTEVMGCIRLLPILEMFKSRSRLGGSYTFPALGILFPALGRSYMFSRGWQRLHVFPWAWLRMLSRACHRLQAFPRLATVVCFPALGIGYARFLRLALVACFPALGIGYVFPALGGVQTFSALGTVYYMFLVLWYVLPRFFTLDKLKISLILMPRGHKQKK